MTNPWNAQVGYTYDNAGRPTGVTGSGYAGVSSYASGIGYRAFGAMKQMNYGNGKSLALQFDNRMRVTSWSVANVLGWQYFYSDVGENTGRVMFARNTASSTVGGGRDDKLDRSFDYDHVGRLIVSHTGYEARLHMNRQQGGDSTNYGPYSQAYNYDVWGNMTTRVGWGGWNGAYVNWTPSYSNNRLTTNPATGAAMTYDASGNLTNDGYQTFSYDATGQQSSAAASGYALSQNYDGDRLRVKKTENSTTTYYLRSSVLGGQVIAELNGSGQFSRGYVYLGGQMVAIQKDNAVSWVHQDPVTKSQRVTNGSGTVVSTIDLDPWGGETSTSSNQAFQPHRFTTYERDGNGGDDAMMRRYVGSWMRFSQPDPYGGSYEMTNPQSLNRYSYVQNDPVNFVDPLGLEECGPGDWCIINIGGRTNISGLLPGGGSGGFLGGDNNFVPENGPTGAEIDPQDTEAPQERLPFNNCAQFVDYLVAFATHALNLIVASQTVNNLPQVAMTVGTAMMSTAYFGYETHIHNGYDGFKDELTSAGKGTAAGEQGAGVYGHIFFAGGSSIFAKGNPAGYLAYVANKGKDWVQAATGWFGGGDQYASERAGNIAGRAVGLHMWNFISGTTPRDPQRLRNSLTKELCR